MYVQRRGDRRRTQGGVVQVVLDEPQGPHQKALPEIRHRLRIPQVLFEHCPEEIDDVVGEVDDTAPVAVGQPRQEPGQER
jgi:hypothetical protein